MNIEIKNLLINFSSNSQNYLADFLLTFFSVLVTAWIGWSIYKQQEKRKRIKNDISNFCLLFFAIISNHGCASAILKKVIVAIKELDAYINALDRVQHLIGCFQNKEDLGLSIQFLDDNAKKSYIMSEINKLRESFSLKETYIKTLGFLKEVNFEKEALFLVSWGNFKFQAIYKNLESEYKQNNNLTKWINQNVELKFSNDRKRKLTEPLCSVNDEDYAVKIEEQRQRAFFFKDFYEKLKDSAEYIAFYSDLACKHLIHFNAKFAKKYRKIIVDSDIAFSEISLAKLYNLDELEYYINNKEEYEECAKLPEYRLLNQNWFEKLMDFNFKKKTKTHS